MAVLNGFANSVAGSSGSVNALEAKSGWFVYVLPRGAYASAASSGTLISFDGTDESGRYATNDWIQVGTNTSGIRQVTGAAGGSIGVNTAVTVSQNDRIFLIGTTQPTVTGGSASYQPNTTIYARDNDSATPISNSKLTTDSSGGYQFYAADALYDFLVQDSNQSLQGGLANVPVGLATTGNLVPDQVNTRSIGTAGAPWNDLNFAGSLISGVSNASGSTIYNFISATAGLTQGNLFAFGVSHSIKVYGDSHGGIFQSWTVPEAVNVRSARFGAKGDNSTDDTAAIAAGITYARTSVNGTAGGQVYLPRGTYLITSQLVLPDNVSLRGDGDRGTYIKADATFPTNTALIRLGDGSGQVAGAFVQDLAIDCAQIAGSIGIYSTEANEPGVAFNCLIQNYEDAGIFLSSLSCQNTLVKDCHLFHTNAAAHGISYNTVGSKNLIVNTTVTSLTPTQSTNAGIGTTATQLKIVGAHVEYHDIGIWYGANSSGTIIGAEGHSSIDCLIQHDSPGVLIFDATPSGSTNLVCDNANGVTLTASSFLQNQGGWYMASNDVAVGGTRSIWTSGTEGTNQVNPNTVFGGTVSFAGTAKLEGQVYVGASASIATGTSVDLTTTDAFVIQLTGTTTVDTLTLQANRMVMLCGGGSFNMRDVSAPSGGNIHTAAAAAQSFTNRDFALFWSPDGSQTFQVTALCQTA